MIQNFILCVKTWICEIGFNAMYCVNGRQGVSRQGCSVKKEENHDRKKMFDLRSITITKIKTLCLIFCLHKRSNVIKIDLLQP